MDSRTLTSSWYVPNSDFKMTDISLYITIVCWGWLLVWILFLYIVSLLELTKVYNRPIGLIWNETYKLNDLSLTDHYYYTYVSLWQWLIMSHKRSLMKHWEACPRHDIETQIKLIMVHQSSRIASFLWNEQTSSHNLREQHCFNRNFYMSVIANPYIYIYIYIWRFDALEYTCFCKNNWLTRHDSPTQGLNRSPILAAFHNSPRNLFNHQITWFKTLSKRRIYFFRYKCSKVNAYCIWVRGDLQNCSSFLPSSFIHKLRRFRFDKSACTNEQQQHREKRSEIKQRRLLISISVEQFTSIIVSIRIVEETK